MDPFQSKNRFLDKGPSGAWGGGRGSHLSSPFSAGRRIRPVAVNYCGDYGNSPVRHLGRPDSEVFLFTPLIIRHVVGLSPVVIILSALVGYELGGFWGILLAIPIAVVIMEYLTDVEKEKILARAGQ